MSLNRLIDHDASYPLDPTATLHNNAWLQDLQDRIDALVGDWTDVPFNAGSFGCLNSIAQPTGAWTVEAGDIDLNRYQVINKTLFWSFSCRTTSLANSLAVYLLLQVPTGTFARSPQTHRVAFVNDGVGVRDCLVSPFDATRARISRLDNGVFSAGTNTLYVQFSGFFELA